MSTTNASGGARRVLWGVGTARALRAHWALAELDLAYRTEAVRARTGETESEVFGRLNPRRKIPVLCDEGLTITESAAIVTYLAERYGGPDTLFQPTDVAGRARHHEWMSFICMELDATSLYVLRRHEHLPEIYGEAPAAIAAARDYFARMIDAAARLVGSDQAFLMGERFTGVDILMTTCLDWAVRYGRPIPEVFSDYRERVVARPAYARAVAANQAS